MTPEANPEKKITAGPQGGGTRNEPARPGPATGTVGGRIPLFESWLDPSVWDSVRACLDSNWVSSASPEVEAFERSVAEFTGAAFAVAAVNGTAALHLALLVAGVGPGDEVVVPSLTFVAPANAVRYCGAWPVFVDVDPVTWQIDPGLVVEFLDRTCRPEPAGLRNPRTGRIVRALLPVHLMGHPADLDPLLDAARRHGLAVVEDAAESLGARYKGRPVGALGDAAGLSFNGNKILTTGGGGMFLTGREEWARRARHLSTQAREPGAEFRHDEVGFNYRLPGLLAALGRGQMAGLPARIEAKRRIARGYAEGLREVAGIGPMAEAPWAESIFWMYTVLVDPARYGRDRRELRDRLADRGIETRPLWQPLPQGAAHRGAFAVDRGAATSLWERGLSLPSSVNLSAEDLARVVGAVRDLRKA